jgi:Fe-S-cluster containining protein
MNTEEKKEKLKSLYEAFEQAAAEYVSSAVCRPGCAYCCIHFGSVDITTLEGLIIRERVNSYATSLRDTSRKKISQNKRLKEKQKIAPCPFLKKDKICRIYDVRPFSCRQLYSLHVCDGRSPLVHRQAVILAQNTVRKLQQLDATGYSGHISFVLALLDRPAFRELYLAGGFNPGQIMAYGKTHDIIINQTALRSACT